MCSSQMLGHSRVREGRGAMSKCPQQLTGLAYKIMVVPLCIVVINLGMVFSTGVTERNAINRGDDGSHENLEYVVSSQNAWGRWPLAADR